MTAGLSEPVPEERQSRFAHPALLYRDDTTYVSAVSDFVRRALDSRQPVMVAVPRPRLDALRARMRADPSEASDASVTWVDMGTAGRNPGRILSVLHTFVGAHPDRGCHIVAESVWAGRTREECQEAVLHEALVNVAFPDRPVSVLCPYDASRLDHGVLAAARRCHPVVHDGHTLRSSQDYGDPLDVYREHSARLPDPPRDAVRHVYAEGDLAAVRRATDDWARGAGLPAARRTDLLLAVCEAATNSIRHGGGQGTLHLWTDSDAVVAEVHDKGALDDPLAGRFRPSPASASGGRGLWMIHELCDLVQIRSLPHGLVLRMSVSR